MLGTNLRLRPDSSAGMSGWESGGAHNSIGADVWQVTRSLGWASRSGHKRILQLSSSPSPPQFIECDRASLLGQLRGIFNELRDMCQELGATRPVHDSVVAGETERQHGLD